MSKATGIYSRDPKERRKARLHQSAVEDTGFADKVRERIADGEITLLSESNNNVDGFIYTDLDNGMIDARIKIDLDKVFLAYGITSTEAKRRVFTRAYSDLEPRLSEEELLRDIPSSLQPRAYRRQFDAETVKAAKQVVNRYNRAKKSGQEFSEEELRHVRAARRIVGTQRQKDAVPKL
jgi:hypothetical protein